MPALADIQPQTQAQVLATQLQLLQLAGLPATAWQSGSVPLTLLQNFTKGYADLTTQLFNVAQGGILPLAASSAFADPNGWVDLIANAHYNLTRKPAVYTQGWLTLTDAGGGGPFTITPTQGLYAGPASGSYRFINANAANVTLPKNGTAVILFQAEQAGASYNLANAAINTLLTPLPGVTVTNVDPGGAYAGGNQGTWISQLGTNLESNASLAARCTQQWSTLGTGATVASYAYWAVTSTPTVTRVNVLENTPTGGQVTVYCAGSTGASSSGDVASVQAYIGTPGSNTGTRPLCVTVNVLAASNLVINIAGTVTVKSALSAAAQSAFLANLNTYQQGLAVGAPIYFSKLVDLLQSIPGVVEVVLTSPASDTTLAPQQVAQFTNSLTWTPV